MNMDAILARVEKLVKLEGDAVVENKTMAYSLRRKVGKKDIPLLFFLKGKCCYGYISVYFYNGFLEAADWSFLYVHRISKVSTTHKKIVNLCLLCKQTVC